MGQRQGPGCSPQLPRGPVASVGQAEPLLGLQLLSISTDSISEKEVSSAVCVRDAADIDL